MVFEIIFQLQILFQEKIFRQYLRIIHCHKIRKIVIVYYCEWRWFQKFQLDAESLFLKSIQSIK